MATIEPNVLTCLWFAVFASIASLGFYQLVGMFPLETRPDIRSHPAGIPLVAANVVLLLCLVAASGIFGAEHLRVTSLIIVTGLALLFTPGLLNAWPTRWRDGIAGLAIAAVALAVAVCAVQRIGNIVHI